MNLQFISWDDLNAIKENLDQYVSKFALPSNAWIEEDWDIPHFSTQSIQCRIFIWICLNRWTRPI